MYEQFTKEELYELILAAEEAVQYKKQKRQAILLVFFTIISFLFLHYSLDYNFLGSFFAAPFIGGTLVFLLMLVYSFFVDFTGVSIFSEDKFLKSLEREYEKRF